MLCKANFFPHPLHQDSADAQMIFQPVRPSWIILDLKSGFFFFFFKAGEKNVKRKEKEVTCCPAPIGL